MSFNIIEFENVIKASNKSSEDIEAKVSAYRENLLKNAVELSNKKDEQTKLIIDFISKIELRYYGDDEPHSVYVGKDWQQRECITLRWDAGMCQMGPIPGTEITIYYKAFAIPVDDLREMFRRTNSIDGIITVEEVDEY